MKTNFRRLLALGLSAAVWHACSAAAFAAPDAARLKAAGDVSAVGPVFIDGAETMSGSTFFSGSEVLTGESGRAVLSLGAEGRAELLPRSSLKLGFGGGRVAGTLGGGVVRFSKPEGVSASVTTLDGTVAAAPEESAVFTVRHEAGGTTVEAETGRVTFGGGDKVVAVAAGERYTTGPQGQQSASNGLSNRQKAVIALGVGGIITLLVIAFTAGEDEEPPEEEPCIIILSPIDGNPPC